MSLSEVVQSVYRQRGLLGFWSGASIGLLQAVPSTVLYMTFYERIKAQLNVSNAVPGGLAPGIAGGLARCVSVSVISPLELVRTIQTGGSKDSATSIIKRIFVSNGVAGLYRGWWSSIMRDAPFSSIYWYSFEFFKDTCIAVTNKRSGTNNHIVNFLSGSAAGIVAAIVTHPFDVLKTQQQLSAGGSSTGSTAVLSVSSPSTLSMSVTNSILSPNPNPTTHSHSTLTMPPTILRLYQQGGVSALYRGLTMRLATVIPSSAIMVTVYEGVKNWNIE